MQVMFNDELFDVDLNESGETGVYRAVEVSDEPGTTQRQKIDSRWALYKGVMAIAEKAIETGKSPRIILWFDPKARDMTASEMEDCCKCQRPTPTWFKPNDVPLCRACADTMTIEQVPTKRDWLNASRAPSEAELPPDWQAVSRPAPESGRSIRRRREAELRQFRATGTSRAPNVRMTQTQMS